MRMFVRLHWLGVSCIGKQLHIFKTPLWSYCLAPPPPSCPPQPTPLPSISPCQFPCNYADPRGVGRRLKPPLLSITQETMAPASQAAVSFTKEYVWRMTFIRPCAVVEVRPRSLITFGMAILHSSSHLTELMDNDAAHPCPFTGAGQERLLVIAIRGQWGFFFFSSTRAV